MKTSLLCFALLVSMLFASLANAATTYTYTGNNFNSIEGTVYSTSDSVSGSFTVTSAFPANMNVIDIRQQVLSYSFTDGVNTFNESNSEICMTDMFGFWVGTDSNGDPNEWGITLCSPVSAVPNPAQLLISANAGEDFVADGGISGTCTEVNEDGCIRFDDVTEGGQIEGQPGTWAQQEEGALGEAAPIPALNTRTTILVAILLGLTGLVSVRRRKIMGSK